MYSNILIFFLIKGTHAWCELKNDTTPILEPWNAISSFVFCFFALYGIYHAPRKAWSYRNILYLCFFTGLGSAVHHAFRDNVPDSHAYDIVPMTLLSGFTFSYVSATLAHSIGNLAQDVSGITNTLLICSMLIAYARNQDVWRVWFMVSVFGIVLVQFFVFVRWYYGHWSFANRIVSSFAWCLLLFLLGAFAWFADDLFIIDGKCVFSLHAVYHVCSAYALFLTITYSLHLRYPHSVYRPAFAKVPFVLYTVKIPELPPPTHNAVPRHLRNARRC